MAMCLTLGITPFVPIFLHYFDVRPLSKGGWVSLTSVNDRCLFRPFFDLYKNFKDQYFKVIIREVGHPEFHDETELPLFPFYWTRNPKKIKAYPVDLLNSTDLEVVRIINGLPVAFLSAASSSSFAMRILTKWRSVWYFLFGLFYLVSCC